MKATSRSISKTYQRATRALNCNYLTFGKGRGKSLLLTLSFALNCYFTDVAASQLGLKISSVYHTPLVQLSQAEKSMYEVSKSISLSQAAPTSSIASVVVPTDALITWARESCRQSPTLKSRHSDALPWSITPPSLSTRLRPSQARGVRQVLLDPRRTKAEMQVLFHISASCAACTPGS